MNRKISGMGACGRAGAALVGGVIALAALLPAGAQAASVQKSGSSIIYLGAFFGEKNNVTISHVGSTYYVGDFGAGVSLAPGVGCTQLSSQLAACSDAGIVAVSALSFDLDDSILVDAPSGIQAIIGGGDGNDRLTVHGGATGPAQNILGGQAGDDLLNGGTGDDRMLGDSGNDSLIGGAGDDDYLPGPGTDAVFEGWVIGASPSDNNTIDTVDSTVDNIYCGPGHEQIKADGFDFIVSLPAQGLGCEAVTRF